MKSWLKKHPLRSKCGGVFFALFFLLAATRSPAQAVLSQGNDSLPSPPDSGTVPVHSVRKATLLSTFLPGAGQVYNRKIWKVPVIYGAFAGMIYLISFNNKNYKKFDNALLLRYDDDPDTVDDYVNIYTEDNLRSLSDFYRRNRDLSVIGLSLVYVLNIIDAHVDAHLFTFNVDDNLSLDWKPIIQPGPGLATSGLTFTRRF